MYNLIKQADNDVIQVQKPFAFIFLQIQIFTCYHILQQEWFYITSWFNHYPHHHHFYSPPSPPPPHRY